MEGIVVVKGEKTGLEGQEGSGKAEGVHRRQTTEGSGRKHGLGASKRTSSGSVSERF